jgi:DNA replication protein DnaC
MLGEGGCDHGRCDGSGWLLDEEANVARPCPCRAQRVATARALTLQHEVPPRYRGLSLERPPIADIVTSMDPAERVRVRDFCLRPDRYLDAGEGIWFLGPRGTGKTSLAMLISQSVLDARRTVAIYTAPQLLTEIRSTYEQGSPHSYAGLMERLRCVDLLHIEDLAVARTNDWVLEQFYTVVNDRYQDRRSIMFTADVGAPSDLGDHIGHRTFSRLMEICGDQIHMFGDDYRTRLKRRPSTPPLLDELPERPEPTSASPLDDWEDRVAQIRPRPSIPPRGIR